LEDNFYRGSTLMNAKRKELMVFKKSPRIFPIRVHLPVSALGSDSLLSRGLKPMNAKALNQISRPP
jgi:hypothetical protein